MWGSGESVTWHHRTTGGTDPYGKPITGWDDSTLENVAVAPGSTSEPRSGSQQRVTTQMTLYLAADPGVASQDQFTVRGERYSVEGDVSGAWVNPFTGWSPGVELALRKVTG